MEIKEAKEVIKAGLAWASWTDEQKKAMMIAYKSMLDVESIKDFCADCDMNKRTIQPFEILDFLK